MLLSEVETHDFDEDLFTSVSASTGGVGFDAAGFTAVTTSGSYSPGSTIQFTNVLTNVGNHYDPSTSVLTCPITGMYDIKLSLVTRSSSSSANIVHDNEVVATARMQSNYYQGSTSAVILCNAGGKVKATAAQSMAIYHHSGTYYNVFSGFLLYPV